MGQGFPDVVGLLRRVVVRHGEHEGQEGRPGEAGGSKPGFTHGDSGEWVLKEDGYATWYDGDKLVKIIADNGDGTYDLEVVSGHDRGAYYDNAPVDELSEPDEDEIELWTSRGADGSINRAVESFGLTENPNEGGYILEDGTMLDFSGSNQGGSSGMRALDHRDIGRILMEDEPGGTEGMVYFMDQTRSVRMSMARSGDLNIDFAHTPTSSQKETIEYMGTGAEAIYWDFRNWNPETKTYWIADSGSIDSPAFEDIRQLWRDLKTASWKEQSFVGRVAGLLRRVVIRHGDHEGQEGREGQAGGSQPGYTHGADSSGKKMTVFHGGARNIKQFDFSRLSKSTGNPTAQWGAFFTPRKDEAERYVSDFHRGEGEVYEADIKLSKPYMMSFSEYEKFVKLDLARGDLEEQMKDLSVDAREFKGKLVSEGYDGIIVGKSGKMRSQEIVVFNPEGLLRFEPEKDGLEERHYSEFHPGTGSPQSVHAGKGKGKTEQYAIPPKKFGKLKLDRERLARSKNWGASDRTPRMLATLDFIERRVGGNDFETGYILAPDGEILLEKVGEENHIEFTDEELVMFEGNILVHNHPSDKSFSGEDLIVTAREGGTEVMALGINGERYMMRLDWRAGFDDLGDMVDEMNKIRRGTIDDFWDKIDNGVFTREQASSNHAREFMKRLENEYPEVFDYVAIMGEK